MRGTQAARAAAAARGQAAKPVLSCFMGSHGVPEGLRSLQEGHIPSYTFPESAAIALARAVRYGKWKAEPDGVARVFAGADRDSAARVIEGATARGIAGEASRGAKDAGAANAAASAAIWLTPDETCALLACYGIGCAGSRFAASAEDAAAAAKGVGFPVAVKLASATLTHKSDVGGVELDVRDERGVREAFAADRKASRRDGSARSDERRDRAADGARGRRDHRRHDARSRRSARS